MLKHLSRGILCEKQDTDNRRNAKLKRKEEAANMRQTNIHLHVTGPADHWACSTLVPICLTFLHFPFAQYCTFIDLGHTYISQTHTARSPDRRTEMLAALSVP